MKDSCPGCGYKFGLRGASRFSDDSRPIFKKCVYRCQSCGMELTREVSGIEHLVSILGYGALLIASTASLWKIAILSQLISDEWMMFLYGTSIIGIGASLVFLFGRQHYLQIVSHQQDSPVDVKS